MRTFAVFLLTVFVTPAFAATLKVPADDPIAVLQFPDKWQTKEVGEAVAATSPDGRLSLLVLPAEGTKVAESIGEAMRYLRNRDGIVVQSDSIKHEQAKLGGADVQKVSWRGKDRKGDVQIEFTIMTMAENKPLLVAHWVSPDAE